MKPIKVFKLLSLIMLSMAMFSCSEDPIGDDDENGGGSSEGGNNNLTAGQIEIKAYPAGNIGNYILFEVYAKKVSYNGIKYAPYGNRKTCELKYGTSKLYTIEVNTEELTSFMTVQGIFEELKFGKCTALTSLKCSPNKLTTLDVSKCTALTSLDCGDNKLTTLDVSKCTALTSLECYFNKLTALDVSKCTALHELKCSSNLLTTLDVSKCTALVELNCRDNQLTALDVSKCTALTWLNCRDNQLTAPALNALFKSLPTKNPSDYDYDYVSISIVNNPGSNDCDKTIAEKKGWKVY
jgi:hypothetical protein